MKNLFYVLKHVFLDIPTIRLSFFQSDNEHPDIIPCSQKRGGGKYDAWHDDVADLYRRATHLPNRAVYKLCPFVPGCQDKFRAFVSSYNRSSISSRISLAFPSINRFFVAHRLKVFRHLLRLICTCKKVPTVF